MSVLVVGMSHRSAPVALLERLSMDDSAREEAIEALVQRDSLSEAMIVSTCNRLEVYSDTDSFHAGVADIIDVLEDVSGVDSETLRSYLYVRFADAAAEHMMVVTSGLDSMVVGEQQIIGQVRTAYQDAMSKGTVGPRLHAIAQSALHVGKRVHTETTIDEAGSSMVTFALDRALEQVGWEDFTGRTVLVLGAGAMASLAATHVGRAGADKLLVANRTAERAERLASHAQEAGVAAQAVDFEARADFLGDVDVVISATGADTFTITAEDVAQANLGEQPLVLVDLSLPRDIEDATADIEGVTLVNIESLHKSVTSRDSSSPAHVQAQKIVAEELRAFQSEQRVREVVPALNAMRERANSIVDSETQRLRAKLPHTTEREFGEITKAIRRVVNEMMHTPTIRAKKLAAEDATVTYGTALTKIFGPDDPEVPSVSVSASELPAVERNKDGVKFTPYKPTGKERP